MSIRFPAGGCVAGQSEKVAEVVRTGGPKLPSKAPSPEAGNWRVLCESSQARLEMVGSAEARSRPSRHQGSRPGGFLPIPGKGPLQRLYEALVMSQDGALPLDVGDDPLLCRPREAAD